VALNTLFAQLLQKQEMRRRERLEQQRYEQTRADAQEQQQQAYILRERELSMRNEDEAFKRKLEVAKLMGTSAGQLGEPKPQGFEMPSTQEYSDAWYDAGRAMPKPHVPADLMEVELERSRRAREGKSDDLTRTLVNASTRQTGYGAPVNPLQEEAAKRAGIPGGRISERQTPDFAPRAESTGGRPALPLNVNLNEKYRKLKSIQEYEVQRGQIGRIEAAQSPYAIIMNYGRMMEPGARAMTDNDFIQAARTGDLGAELKQKFDWYSLQGGRLTPEQIAQIKAEARRQFAAGKKQATLDTQAYADLVPEYDPQTYVNYPELLEGWYQPRQAPEDQAGRSTQAPRDELDDRFDLLEKMDQGR